MNKYYISHIFKESMGISIHQYMIQKRIEACKNALLTQKSLEEIAAMFGFANYSSFFRLLKRLTVCPQRNIGKKWKKR